MLKAIRYFLPVLGKLLTAVAWVSLALGFGATVMVGMEVGKQQLLQAQSQETYYRVHTEDLPFYTHIQDFSSIRPYYAVVVLDINGSHCSGTVISDDYIVTAAHCLVTGSFIPEGYADTIKVYGVNNRNEKSDAHEALVVAINTRADFGILRGQFQDFGRIPIMDNPSDLGSLKGPLVSCGFPWGGSLGCYGTGGHFEIDLDQVATTGFMVAGMSGGPVIDPKTGALVAVNTAVGEGIILISLVTNIFDSLGIPVKL